MVTATLLYTRRVRQIHVRAQAEPHDLRGRRWSVGRSATIAIVTQVSRGRPRSYNAAACG